MSQLNMNDLPSEMLTKIFRRLDAVDLKNATLACKLWNNLIESGCRWSVSVYYNEGFENYVHPRHVQKMNFILTTKRRFGRIRISDGCLSEDSQMLEIFRRQGFNVAQLRLHGCRIDNRAVFTQLLKLIPNLESLDIEMMKLHNVTDVPLDPVLPELKKLKILYMSQSQSPIIECFRNAKLTTIHIDDDDEQDTETEPLVDFLSSQPTLTSLTIAPGSLSHLSIPTILAQMGKLDVPIPFRLTKLEILGLGDLNSSQDHDNLVRFIESQAESLTELDLGWNIPMSVYESVFASLTKLRTLKLSLDVLPKDDVFYNRLKENRSVCTMVLRSSNFDVPWLGEILNRLPNIRRLILPVYGLVKESSLAVMAQHLGRLESLSICSIRFSFGYLKFTNLRTLHIGHLFAKINWNEFTKANPRLVELIIEKIFEHKPLLTSDDIDQITTNVDLQYLRLGEGFVADDRFFEIIRAKCTNLKVLELHRSCVPHGLRHNVENNVLRLCDKIYSPTVSTTWLI